MDEDATLAEFEKTFPKPQGIFFNRALGFYDTNRPQQMQMDVDRQNMRWQAWRSFLESEHVAKLNKVVTLAGELCDVMDGADGRSLKDIFEELGPAVDDAQGV